MIWASECGNGVPKKGQMMQNQRDQMQRFAEDEGGAALVWNLFWVLIFLVLGGLAVDASNAWRMQSLLQSTADSAASAAAVFANDTVVARATAQQIADRNMPAAKNGGPVVDPSSVEFGVWDSGTGGFSPGGTAPEGHATQRDAIRVTASRASATGNQVPTYLLRLAGFDTWDVQATAIAVAEYGIDPCLNAQFQTEGSLILGGNNVFSETCAYGEVAVTTGGNDWYAETVEISSATTLNLATTRADSVLDETQVAEMRVRENVITPTLQTTFDTFWAEYPKSIPVWTSDFPLTWILTGSEFVLKPTKIERRSGDWVVGPADLVTNTLYLVDGNVIFGDVITTSGVAIVASGSITGGAYTLQLHNSVLMSQGSMVFSGDVTWGPTTGNYCDLGYFNTYLMSLSDISLDGFTGGTGIYGVLAAALGTFDVGTGLSSAGSIYFESVGDMQIGGSASISGCAMELDTQIDTDLPGELSLGSSFLVD